MNATHIIARMKHHKFSGRMAWLARWMERKGWLTVALGNGVLCAGLCGSPHLREALRPGRRGVNPALCGHYLTERAMCGCCVRCRLCPLAIERCASVTKWQGGGER
jgi:hypothetical protein